MTHRIRHLFYLALVLPLAWLVGCNSPYMRWPQLYSPGPAPYQRAEAVVHDPYPLDDVAPPIVGGRPLGYLKPVPEVERARMASPRRATVPLAIPFTNTQIMPSASPPIYSQNLPGAPPPVVNAPPNAAPIVYDPYATSPPAAVPYSPPQPVPAPFSTPQPAPAYPYSVPSPAPAPYAVGPPTPAPYTPAPYSSVPPAQPAAPYQYTPATPLEAFPSRVPY
jgi:hypothetical protein